MLLELNIKNYALIDHLKIEFDPGLNVLTGETGAGKSIIIDALGSLLGDKMTVHDLRKGASACEMVGTFDMEKNKAAHAFLKSLSLENGSDETLILRREFDANARSKAYINDKPVNLSTLLYLGELLVDIHGQHEHQRLLKPNEQRDLLDNYAGCGELKTEVSKIYFEWRAHIKELESFQLSEAEKVQRIDLYRFQLNEIESAKLKPGEEEEMDRILPQLKNSEKLQKHANDVYSELYGSDGSVTERLHKIKKSLDVVHALGIDLIEIPTLLEETFIRVNEITAQIETFRDHLESDPKKLDALISRQDLIAKLKKKYGLTIPDILQFGEKVKAELKGLENHSHTYSELEDKIRKIKEDLIKQSKKLSQIRKKHGEELSKEVIQELRTLGFPKANFQVQHTLEKDEKGREILTASGLEKVEFMFSANAGESLKPLKSVVSGGEMSRIMLALKKILAEVDLVPTLIFDEIDSGIGGSMGHVLGEKLKNLSQTHQILAITHLPQIAAYSHRHFVTRKVTEKDSTRTYSEALDKEKRVEEIARMLGGISGNGKEPTAVSLKHAAELLANAKS